MPQRFDRFSFAAGLIVAAILACSIGAVADNGKQAHRYDASNLMGGLGLQIVDHQTNTLYNDKRDKRDDSATYKLMESVDLSQAGKKEIQAKLTDDE